jgi:hypothetical protein
MLGIKFINDNNLIVKKYLLRNSVRHLVVGWWLDGIGWLRVGGKKGWKLYGGGGALVGMLL